MSYRCQACRTHVEEKQALLRHTVLREVRDPVMKTARTEIAREVPVCASCSAELLRLRASGVPSGDALSVLCNKYRPGGMKILDAFPTPNSAPA